MARRGRDFENAVYEFCKTLDPAADVRFDHKVRDRDIGAERQVDVWITCKALGHFPMAILVSCKDHARPLDMTEIDQFHGEIHSTGATNGVLYSRAGFTKDAIRKARKRSISCCRLFDNAPPEVPTELLLDMYVAYPRYVVLVQSDALDAPSVVRWRDLPPLRVAGHREPFPMALVVAGLCHRAFDASQASGGYPSNQSGPASLVCLHDIPASAINPGFCIHAALTWEWFQGRLNAFRLSGSFNATDESFLGNAKTPVVPINTPIHEGDWARCDVPPPPGDRMRITISALACPDAERVGQVMGDASVFRGGPWCFGAPAVCDVAAMIRNQFAGGSDFNQPSGMQLTIPFGRVKPI